MDSAEGVGEVKRVDAAPLPSLRIRAEALLQVIERAAQGLEDEFVPGPADQILVALLPEAQEMRVPAPG